MRQNAFWSKSISSLLFMCYTFVPVDQMTLFYKAQVKMALTEFDSQFPVS